MSGASATGLKRQLKHGLAAGCGRALRWSGATSRFFADRLPIVFYHGIWPAGSAALARFDSVELERLERELKLLRAHFDFVGLRELLHGERRPGTRPPLAVCFDDGCDMIRSGAADLLDSLGVSATMFVITACVDNRHLMWMHKLQAIAATRGEDRLVSAYNDLMARRGDGPEIGARHELTAAVWCWPMARKEEYVDSLYQACDMPPVDAHLDEFKPYMTWDELRGWLARGHAVGLHTHSHPFCDRLEADDVAGEVVAPAARIRTELGVDDVPFAYPFGNRFPEDREAQVADEARLSCMLGVAGVSSRGTEPRRVERVSAEDGLDRSLFGKPLLESLVGIARPGAPPVRPALAVAYRRP